MFSKLIIIDASACVYTGMYSKRHKDKSYYGYPVGGLHYLFRYVVTALAQTSHVIVAFDSRSFRKIWSMVTKQEESMIKEYSHS